LTCEQYEQLKEEGEDILGATGGKPILLTLIRKNKGKKTCEAAIYLASQVLVQKGINFCNQ